MKRTPNKGDPYQLCIHLAAEPKRTDRKWWHVPSRDSWIVLCNKCHAAFTDRKSVDVHAEILAIAADAPKVSTAYQCAPDVVLVDKPAGERKEPPKIFAATLPRQDKLLDVFPLIDRGLTTLTELSRAFQAHTKARADLEIRRMELEAQGVERMIRMLDACTASAERMTTLAIEQDAVLFDRVRRFIATARELDELPKAEPQRPAAGRV